jgi:membrane-associated protease RseP (regulator of RpoE activity)
VTESGKGSYTRLIAAVGSAVLIAWGALAIRSHTRAASVPSAAANTAQMAAPDVADTREARATDLPAVAQPVSLAYEDPLAVGARGQVTGATAADERQLAKITRGMSANPGGGIRVEATPPGSVTGQMRLRVGDVIVTVNGEPISTPDEFARIYRAQGMPHEFTILRNGREIHRHRS